MRTYESVMAQANKLIAEANRLKAVERTQVIKRVARSINDYEITMSELQAELDVPLDAPRYTESEGRAKSDFMRLGTYRLGERVWTGRGPKPNWLREYLAAGGNIETIYTPTTKEEK